jgi:hypothetical protein
VVARIALATLVLAGGALAFTGYGIWRDHSPRQVYSHTLYEDGWISHSRGSGTCSWHRGVDHYVFVDMPAPSGGWSSLDEAVSD